MLAAWGVHALVPLQAVRLWLAVPWVLALGLGGLTLLAIIGSRTSLLQKASDVAWLNRALRWLQPLCALLATLLLALAADRLVNGLRGPSGERDVVLRRVHCVSVSNRPIRSTADVAEKNGKWCFDAGGLVGSDVRIPVEQIRRPVPLGETAKARWRSYHSIFGMADGYYQIVDVH
ncbi:hypothetical protein D8I35_11170 [Corticibacter populi]|uniref:Uncharacterized protein n=1 Tax=Corticibacter populi TaxID=1550736 RepID=A0A3M6QRQ8_9BURK|nr:hypothetical protein [Corticibacter populi]RMX05730.1 hypothetical protein D8I35_11170 [Corticibacter populi]RZS30972.1 hypothetical protein EV687_3174 [Corticibacter populi]